MAGVVSSWLVRGLYELYRRYPGIFFLDRGSPCPRSLLRPKQKNEKYPVVDQLVKTSANNMDVLLFDDAVDVLPYLHRLLSFRERSPLLSSFLKNVTFALRTDIADLPKLQRQDIPPLTNLLEFLEAYKKCQKRSAPIENTLLSIAQFSYWIGMSEECPELLSEDLSILGSGVGLLTAASVSSFMSPSACIPLAVETVRVAFRLGLHVDAVADRLRPRSQDEERWSVLVSGVSEIVAKYAVDGFNVDTGFSAPNHAYISAISPSGVTISGPPKTLRRLFDSSDCFKGSQNADTKVLGPYNAPHLHNEDSIPGILGENDEEIRNLFASSTPVIPISSASRGTCYTASSVLHLFAQILNDVLLKRQNFSLALHECVERVSSAHQDCRVVSVGPSNTSASVVSAMQSNPSLNVSVLDYEPGQEAGRRNSAGLGKSKIAIVGMSGRFPGAQDVEEFWDVLEKGLDMHKEVPLDRFDPKLHFDPSGKIKNTSHTPFGCFIENAGLFDPRFFNMSPREAVQTDPMQRLALITAYEALEMSGYVPNRTPSTKLDRIGTFYGQTSDDWREINEAQDIDTYFITGGVRAFGPGRINYHFKFSGPSFNIDTACSSSMAAIQLSCTSLWAGDCDTAIAGGLNIMTNPDIFSGLSRGQFLSKVGPCQTFDNDADGYCRGDGIGTVILKRLEDAEADHDNILGVILASATNHSADAISITHPHDKTQEILYKKVLDQAGVDPLDVGLVEMHGTGTQAGDGTEMRSVTNVFAPSDRLRRPDQKLYLGSVKANVGHGEAASGVTALVKSLLILRKNAIPPHVGVKKELNKGFPKDLAQRNVHIAFQQASFQRPQHERRRIFVNNFSAAGGNSAVLIEDGPIRQLRGIDSRPTHVVSVSARALSSLKSNLQRLVTYLDENPNLSLPSLSYTTTARRMHHNYRISFPSSDAQKLRNALANAAETDIEPKGTPPKVAFTFTGQGSHYASLGANLFETCDTFKSDLIYFDSIAMSLDFVSFLSLVDGSVDDVSSLSPLLIQVGLTCVQMALFRLWASWGVKPDVVIGHSLGEYAALNAAGVLSVVDTILLVGERARLLDTKCTAGTHAMLAVKAGVSDVSDVLKSENIEVACINGPMETVLSGTISNIDATKDSLEARGVKATKLSVPYAFHSSQVDSILPDFERIASSVDFNAPTTAFMSPLLSSAQMEGSINAAYLCRHARETVNFVGALRAGQENNTITPSTVFIEIGPHPVTLGFVKSTLGSSVTAGGSLRRNEAPWVTLASTASLVHNQGVEIDWNEYHRDFVDAHELLELPAYSWAYKNYWIQYKNNWCLTKGDLSIAPPTAMPVLSTTSVQNIIDEDYSDGKGTLVAESDVARPDLYAAISGHLVNGAALCPSSIYGDVGVTIGEHMYKQLWELPSDSPVPAVNVRNMEVPKPLIAKPGMPQILKITARADKALGRVDLVFSTGTTEHAKCVLEYGDSPSWLSEWQRVAHMVESRVESLSTQAKEGKSHTLLQGMAYKLFAALVQYEDSYRGMQRVILDGKHLEATADIVCQPCKEGQNFVFPPYWIDSVGHLAGFVMNANDELDSKSQVYVSHGWESMRFSKPVEQGKAYRTYVRMLPIEGQGKVVSGDVYLFDNKTIVGVIGGLKFQCIPRKVLDTLLPPPGAPIRPTVTITEEVRAQATTKDSLASKGIEKIEKVQKVDRKVSVTKSISVVSQVMAIIAEECGVDNSELADGNSFGDLGVDSLMQLAISGRMRENLELEVHSTMFAEYPTVGALKEYLATLGGSSEETEEAEEVEEDSSDTTSSTLSDRTRQSSLTSPDSPHHVPEDVYSQHEKVSRALESLANQELGSDAHDFSKGMGMDFKVKQISPPMTPPPKRLASSVILQGNPKTATQKFFIFPDGGGSATSYVLLPDLSPDICVYGMNSPYMKSPEEYTCGVPGMAEAFITEIRRRQPQGPYMIGGWSAGGVIAFEGAQQLIRAGEQVSRLVLIDAPCPLIIEPLPISLHRWFNSIGLLGDPKTPSTKIPDWLLPHFQASINALSTYNARAIDSAKAPTTFAIWCTDGVCKYPDDPRPHPYPYGHAQWLLENRTDFGPNLWDAMVGAKNVRTAKVEGNHFSMMKAPNVQRLGDEIRKALTCEI